MTSKAHAKLPHLSVAIGSYGHTAALKDGSVPIDGFDVTYAKIEPIIAAFRLMIRSLEFDVCELAPTTYLIARSCGIPLTALPIFLMRRFHHGGFVCRADAGIKTPKDLEGKRAGVRAYSVTTGVWTRGIFANEYDLDLSKVTWVVDDEEHVNSLKLPPNVQHAPAGDSIARMIAKGEIQGAFTGAAGIGRVGQPCDGWESGGQTKFEIYPELISNSREMEKRWFERTGIYPIHGALVVKSMLVDRYPHLPAALFSAFAAAKASYLYQLKSDQANSIDDRHYQSLSSVVGDPLPYGISLNNLSIEALIDYSQEQGLISRRPELDELFIEP